jgi:PEP-CTERM motif
MAKKIFSILVFVYLMASSALAETFTINSMLVWSGINSYGVVGHLDLTVNGEETWGYAIEPGPTIWVSTGELQRLLDSQMWQAQLIYEVEEQPLPFDEWKPLAIVLQDRLFGVMDLDAQAAGAIHSEELRSMYLWANIPYGQDLIVAYTNHIPEPATMILLGTGLISLTIFERKKLKYF